MKFPHASRLALMLPTALCLGALSLGACRPAGAQVQDGGFEQPHYDDQTNIHTGSTFGPWHVVDGNIDIVPAKDWQPEEGTQSIDLSGDTAGTIYQDVPTTPGQKYQLSFYLAGNDHDQPDTKSLNVLVDNTQAGHFTFDTTHTSPTDMGWRLTQVNFTATASTTRITFQSLTYSSNGPALDNVRVTPVSSGSMDHTHLLWTNTDGTAAIWTINPDGSITSTPAFGPIAGWTAKSIADGSDGLTRMLWTRSDGMNAVWTVNDATGSITSTPGYGPMTGWSVASLAVGPDNRTRLQWKRASDGTSAVWTLGADGGFTSLTSYAYGPWSASALAVGSDGMARLLWGDGSGQFAVWTPTTDGGFAATASYAPSGGWSATAIASGPDTNARLLLNRFDGAMAVWTVTGAGAVTSTPLYGPISGFTCQGLAVGPDALSQVLWSRTDGASAVWTVDPAGSITSTPLYGPMAGWSATAISVGP